MFALDLLRGNEGSEEFFAIELKESGKVIGNVYFGKRDFEAREIGYIVNKDYQRKGYAVEAVNAVLEYAFSNNIHRVFAECDPENECSWRLLEKIGFSKEAHLRKNVYFRKDDNDKPVWQDTYIYGLLNSEEI